MKLTIAAAALLHPVGQAKGEVGEKVDNHRESSAQSTESIDPAINQVSAETMEAAEVITPKVLIDIGILNIYKKSLTKIQVGSSGGAPHTDAEPPRYEESSFADRLDLVYGNVQGALAAGGKGGKASMPDSNGGKSTKSSKVTEEPPQTQTTSTTTTTKCTGLGQGAVCDPNNDCCSPPNSCNYVSFDGAPVFQCCDGIAYDQPCTPSTPDPCCAPNTCHDGGFGLRCYPP